MHWYREYIYVIRSFKWIAFTKPGQLSRQSIRLGIEGLRVRVPLWTRNFSFCILSLPTRSWQADWSHANEIPSMTSIRGIQVHREKVNFKSREVNCLKECALALINQYTHTIVHNQMYTYFACLISRMISDNVSKFTISFCTYIGTIILFAVFSWNCYAIRSHSLPWTPDYLWEYLCISGFANVLMEIPFILLCRHSTLKGKITDSLKQRSLTVILYIRI